MAAMRCRYDKVTLVGTREHMVVGFVWRVLSVTEVLRMVDSSTRWCPSAMLVSFKSLPGTYVVAFFGDKGSDLGRRINTLSELERVKVPEI